LLKKTPDYLDASALKSLGLTTVPVQVRPAAPKKDSPLGLSFFVCFDYLDGLEGGSHFAGAKCFAVSNLLSQTTPRQRRQLPIVERGVSASGF